MCAVVTVHIHENPMHDVQYIIKYIKHNSYNELVNAPSPLRCHPVQE